MYHLYRVAGRPTPVTVKLVAFDYGGTLVTQKKPWTELKPSAVRAACRVVCAADSGVGMRECLEANVLAFERCREVGAAENRDVSDLVAFQETVRGVFPAKGEAWRSALARQATDAFWDAVKRNFRLRRSTKPALRRLKEMEVRMAVISNHHYPPALYAHLNRLRIAEYFPTICASADVGVRKPDPRIFHMCLRRMRASPAQTVFVGDSLEFDVQGANSVGIRSVFIPGEERPGDQASRATPDYIIRDLDEVPEIVSSLM